MTRFSDVSVLIEHGVPLEHSASTTESLLPFARMRLASPKAPFVACWCGIREGWARPTLYPISSVSLYDVPLSSIRPPVAAQVFCP
jgi:hypothetical protein